MRVPILIVTVLFGLASLAATTSASGKIASNAVKSPSLEPLREATALSPLGTDDYLLEPGNGQWLRFSPTFLRIQVSNGPVDIVPERSALRLDGKDRSAGWVDSTATFEAIIIEILTDGIHTAEASLVHGNGSATNLTWNFGLDTVAPALALEPLPAATPNLTLEVRGRVTDAWLASLTVWGFDVAFHDGNFAVFVRLWPGVNDIVVEAHDRAGNLGRAVPAVVLQIPEFEGAMERLVVENASFAIDIPEGWAAQETILLPSGNRADLVALAPRQPGLETSLIVMSDSTSVAYSESRALEWMDLVLASVAANGQMKQVVGRPRLLEDPAGTLAVQSSFLRQTASSLVAFMQITMVWSYPLRTQWVLLASADERRGVEDWPALIASVATFEVLDKGIGEPARPESAFVGYTILVIAATAALVGLAVVALLPTYVEWRKARREGRWRPPRNWKL